MITLIYYIILLALILFLFGTSKGLIAFAYFISAMRLDWARGEREKRIAFIAKGIFAGLALCYGILCVGAVIYIIIRGMDQEVWKSLNAIIFDVGFVLSVFVFGYIAVGIAGSLRK